MCRLGVLWTFIILQSAFPSVLDTVGWVTGSASGLYKVWCWFVGVDDLTGALHAL